MATYYSQAMDYSESLYTPIAPSSLSLQTSFPKTENVNRQVTQANNLLTNSLLIANNMDAVVTSSDRIPFSSWPTTQISSTQAHTAPLNSMVVTPPPETSGFPPAYPYSIPSWNYGLSSHPTATSSIGASTLQSSVADSYLYGSSLEDSPLSSPGSAETNLALQEPQLAEDVGYAHSQSMPTSSKSHSPLCDNVYTQASTMLPNGYESSVMTSSSYNAGLMPTMENKTIDFGIHMQQKEVKMPQRKGGIQLWQFLYSLLTNAEKKYKDIIEWTSNMQEKEFRMLEPECIAVWWGHHKNKPTMTYDKFSRSLRYYYDKGILKKIPGERFVYRFMIDPEIMYRHIGTSDCRPKVKPMPQAAKAAMAKFPKGQNVDFKGEDVPIITQEAVPLEHLETGVTSILTSTNGGGPDSWPVPFSSSCGSNSLQVGASTSFSLSTGNLAVNSDTEATSLPMKRCKSLDSTGSIREDTTGHLPASCPATTNNFKGVFSPDLTIHSQVHSVVSEMDTRIVSSMNQLFSAPGCDSYYSFAHTC